MCRLRTRAALAIGLATTLAACGSGSPPKVPVTPARPGSPGTPGAPGTPSTPGAPGSEGDAPAVALELPEREDGALRGAVGEELTWVFKATPTGEASGGAGRKIALKIWNRPAATNVEGEGTGELTMRWTPSAAADSEAGRGLTVEARDVTLCEARWQTPADCVRFSPELHETLRAFAIIEKDVKWSIGLGQAGDDLANLGDGGGGGSVPGGGGSDPGGSVPGGSVPGGSVPGGSVPGGSSSQPQLVECLIGALGGGGLNGALPCLLSSMGGP